MSVGEQLEKGNPVVFTGREVPEVVCEPGKEKEALELMVKLKLISLVSPVREPNPDAGKTESELAAEVFDPEVSDLEYFLSRQAALSGKGK